MLMLVLLALPSGCQAQNSGSESPESAEADTGSAENENAPDGEKAPGPAAEQIQVAPGDILILTVQDYQKEEEEEPAAQEGEATGETAEEGAEPAAQEVPGDLEYVKGCEARILFPGKGSTLEQNPSLTYHVTDGKNQDEDKAVNGRMLIPAEIALQAVDEGGIFRIEVFKDGFVPADQLSEGYTENTGNLYIINLENPENMKKKQEKQESID